MDEEQGNVPGEKKNDGCGMVLMLMLVLMSFGP
jgi:hypothetical protein